MNHFGHFLHFLLCGLLFDRIEASKGRIVVVGSNAYKMGLKKIQFEDLNFDKKYTAWNSYAQSKLAQMMLAYELQRRVQAAGKSVQVQVCHPGASRTNLLKDNRQLVQQGSLVHPLSHYCTIRREGLLARSNVRNGRGTEARTTLWSYKTITDRRTRRRVSAR